MFIVEENRTIYVENNTILGEVTYPFISFNAVDINHTFVDINLRGKGIADKLLTKAFIYFKKNNIRVKCSCSYAKKWISNHSEYQDLLIK